MTEPLDGRIRLAAEKYARSFDESKIKRDHGQFANKETKQITGLFGEKREVKSEPHVTSFKHEKIRAQAKARMHAMDKTKHASESSKLTGGKFATDAGKLHEELQSIKSRGSKPNKARHEIVAKRHDAMADSHYKQVSKRDRDLNGMTSDENGASLHEDAAIAHRVAADAHRAAAENAN